MNQNSNPYSAPKPVLADASKSTVCRRRLDVAFIAVAFAVASIASVFSLKIPEFFAWLNPRFGFSLNLLLFPLNFLCMFLWRPAPKLLWAATGMIAVVAIISGATIWWKGTVATVSNPFFDRLHSAYLFSVIPLILVAIYLACVSWQIRRQIAASNDSK